jgi:hypothetical protein
MTGRFAITSVFISSAGRPGAAVSFGDGIGAFHRFSLPYGGVGGSVLVEDAVGVGRGGREIRLGQPFSVLRDDLPMPFAKDLFAMGLTISGNP